MQHETYMMTLLWHRSMLLGDQEHLCVNTEQLAHSCTRKCSVWALNPRQLITSTTIMSLIHTEKLLKMK